MLAGRQDNSNPCTVCSHLLVGEIVTSSSLEALANLLGGNGVQVSTGKNAINDGRVLSFLRREHCVTVS